MLKAVLIIITLLKRIMLNIYYNRIEKTYDKKYRNIPFIIIISAIALAFILIITYSGSYLIKEGETGLIYRMESFQKLVQPGEHFIAPFGIDQVEAFKSSGIFTLEFGFRALKNEAVGIQYPNDQLIFTSADHISLKMEFVVQYEITDSLSWKSKYSKPDDHLRVLIIKAVSEHVFKFDAVFILRGGRYQITESIEDALNDLISSLSLGVKLKQLYIKTIDFSSKDVKEKYNSVPMAEQEMKVKENNLRSDYFNAMASGKLKASAEKRIKKEGFPWE